MFLITHTERRKNTDTCVSNKTIIKAKPLIGIIGVNIGEKYIYALYMMFPRKSVNVSAFFYTFRTNGTYKMLTKTDT